MIASQTTPNRKIRRRPLKLVLGEAVMLFLSLLMLIPFYYLFVNVFKTQQEVAMTPLALPSSLYFDNLVSAFSQMRFFNAFKNTAILTLSSLAIVMVFGSMAGYAVSRRKHPIYRIIMLYFLLGFMIPLQTTMIPLFLLMQKLGLINKIYGLIILSSGGCTFSFFLYQGFISTIPFDLEESARIDGANVWQTFWVIIFPLLQPVTVTLSIFHVMGSWNDFVTPFLFLHSRDNATLMLEMYRGVGEFSNDWPRMLSSMVIIISPLVLFYLIAQRYIIDGLVAGAVKG
ncbi:MAG: carbohydrate ABC transporter permease [Eubacteriales bacterium]|nr:carbohydrate ABC transporter permease [Eubacteriales bacterium]